jgi:hypothetical protein
MVATLFQRNEVPHFLRSRRCLRKTFQRYGFLQIPFEIRAIQIACNPDAKHIRCIPDASARRVDRDSIRRRIASCGVPTAERLAAHELMRLQPPHGRHGSLGSTLSQFGAHASLRLQK